MWIEDEKGAVPCALVEVDPEKCVRQHPAANHDRSAVGAEVDSQLSGMGRDVGAPARCEQGVERLQQIDI